MNFLAHAYLSGNDRNLIIGNFIADSVRGKEINQFSDEIKNGILLHRKIDAYTDNHPVVGKTIDKLKPHFNRYASVVSDIYYDHFLALYWSLYSTSNLPSFIKDVYTIIQEELPILPPEVNYFFPYMIRNNWLFNYQTFHGMERVFEGMAKRTSFPSNMENAVSVLKNHYLEFEEEFKLFFPELSDYTTEERKKMGYY